MSLLIPPAKNYTDPLVMQVSRVGLEPTEGRRQVNCEIQWGNYTGNSVNVNLQQNATLALTQIIALSVDNSQCGADVQFIFPDSSDVLTIPAGNPKTIVEVFTSSKQFYVTTGLNGQIVLAADTTRFIILNYLPPPIAVPTSEEQNTAALGAIVAGGTTVPSTVLVAAGISGTLENMYVYRGSPQAGLSGPGSQTWDIEDGTGKVYASGTFAGGNLSSWNVPVLQLAGVRYRFNNGLLFKQAGDNLGGTWSVNIGYRIP
jgi:hypothetical protein